MNVKAADVQLIISSSPSTRQVINCRDSAETFQDSAHVDITDIVVVFIPNAAQCSRSDGPADTSHPQNDHYKYRLGVESAFYRAIHFSAKRGIAIACRLSVRPSVCL